MIVARNVIIERDHVERVGARKQQRDPTLTVFLAEADYTSCPISISLTAARHAAAY
jgi:hypothetical protein